MDLHQLHALAAEHFAKHGLAGWSFALSNSKRRLGVCKYKPKRIEIARYYAEHNPEAAVLDTLLHEIAHALAGHGAGHGPEWRAIAERIGATPKACDTSPDTVIQPGDWQAVCPGCNRTHHRYKRPRVLSGYRCRCHGKSPLAFAFAGSADRAPPALPVREVVARWIAPCAGCGTVHKRLKRPKAGRWLCRCGHKGELKWIPNPEAA
jgi:predicted SprT family Zn-dependent metalloprotease